MSEHALMGQRVLVVEDEMFIAFDHAEAVRAAGGEVVGPAVSVADANQLLNERHIDAAILDVNLLDGEVIPVLEALRAKGRAVVVNTGAYAPDELASRYPGLAVFGKPATPAALIDALAEQLTRA